MINSFFIFSTNKIVIFNQRQQSSTDNQQLIEQNIDIELLPIVKHNEGSHDEGSHDATAVDNSEVSRNEISYRQLPQEDNDENDESLENSVSNQKSKVSETESECESSEILLNTKQGIAKRTRNAFISTLTVTMAILR